MTDDLELEKPALAFRNPTLVVAIVGYVADADRPVPWNEILETYREAAAWKTLENVLYELLAFGALHRIGKPGTRGRPDTRALKITRLGRAWLDRDLLPLPTDRDQPDEDELDRDALELAEQIAEELEGLADL